MSINKTNLINNFNEQTKMFFTVNYNVVDEGLDNQNASININSNYYNIEKLLNSMQKQNDNLKIISYEDGSKILNTYSSFEYLVNPTKYIDNVVNNIKILGKYEDIENFYVDITNITNILVDYIDKYELAKKIVKEIDMLPKDFLDINVEKLLTEDTCNNIKIYTRSLKNVDEKILMNLSKKALEIMLNQIAEIDIEPAEKLFEEFVTENLKFEEYHILQDRYSSKNTMTLQEIGDKHNVTRERIRQIEKRALSKITQGKVMYKIERMLNQLEKITPYKFIIMANNYDEQVQETIKILCGAGFLSNEYFSDIYFFNKDVEKTIKNELSKLPADIFDEDFDAYIEKTQEALRFDISFEEIAELLKNTYNQFGILWTNSRPSNSVVIPYLVAKFFPDGISSNNKAEQDVLREKSVELIGFELSEKVRALQTLIERYCIQVGRGRYGIKKDVAINDELMYEIIDYIENYDSGNVPYQAVYDVFMDELTDLGIENKYFLHGKLLKNSLFNYKTDRDYIIKDTDTNIYNKLEEFVKNSGEVTKEKILSNIDGITDSVLNLATFNTGIISMYNYYVHIDNLDITDDDKIDVAEILDNNLLDNKPVNAKHIYELSKEKLQGFYSKVKITDYKQMFNVFRAMLHVDYEFKRPFIAKKGVVIHNTTEQMAEEIKQQGEINLSELRELRKRVGKNIGNLVEFIDELNNIIIFKNKNELITIDLAYSYNNIDNLDAILQQYLSDNLYKSLKDFDLYDKLPILNIPWNEWVLYSLINKYSNKYYAVMSSKVLYESEPYVVNKLAKKEEIVFN